MMTYTTCIYELRAIAVISGMVDSNVFASIKTWNTEAVVDKWNYLEMRNGCLSPIPNIGKNMRRQSMPQSSTDIDILFISKFLSLSILGC